MFNSNDRLSRKDGTFGFVEEVLGLAEALQHAEKVREQLTAMWEKKTMV